MGLGCRLILRPFCAGLVAVVLLGGVTGASAQDWTEFRGSRQGVGTDTATPTEWSPDHGLRWKTPIKGQGNSSPVVVGDKIYISTAYPSTSTGFVKSSITYGLGILTILVGLCGIRAIVQSCRVRRDDISPVRQTLSVAAFTGGVAAVLFLLFFGPSAIDYDRCVIRAWLGSGILVGLSVLLTEFQSPPATWRRPIIGLFSIAYGIAVFIFVPSKDHAFGGGMMSAAASTVWASALVPVLAGMVALFNYWVSRKQAGTAFVGAASHKLPKLVQASYGFIFLVGMVLAATVGALIVRQRPAPGEETSWAARAVPMNELALWLAGAAPVVLGLVFLMASGLWSTPPQSEARKGDSALRQFFGSVGLCLGGFGITAAILIYLIKNSPFLTYHLADPKWNPVGGWPLFYAGIACGALFAIYELSRLRRARPVGSIVPAGMRTLLLITAGLAFVRANLISNQTANARSIMCLDCATGKELWTCEGLFGLEGQLHKINSPATPTLVVEGDRVYGFFGYAGAMCCDTSGKLIWTNPDVQFFSMYGAGGSPIVHKDKMIIVCATPKEPTMYALDCKTGKLIWKEAMPLADKWVESGASRTPIIRTIQGKDTLLSWDFVGLSGHDPDTGKRLWDYPIPTTAQEGDLVASIVSDEEKVYCGGPVETVAFYLSKLGTSQDPIAWRTKVKGANCVSPILSHGKLFMCSDGGIGVCLDAKTGKLLWRERLVRGEHYASPVASGKFVYFTSDDGVTTILDATSESFKKVASCDMKAPTYASFAPLKDCFIGRTEKHLFCVDGARAMAKRPG